MKRAYLLPVLLIMPLMIGIYLIGQLDFELTPLVVGAMIAVYVAANITYSVIKGTFHVSMLVELSMVSLIAYLVLVNVT